VADADALSAILLSHRSTLTADPSGAGAEAFFERLSPAGLGGFIASPAFSYLVAWDDEVDRAVAFIGLREQRHVFHLFVARTHQGRGLGRRLWARARDEALRAGNPGGFTVNASLPSVPAYRAFGFVETGEPAVLNGLAFVPMAWRATS
jgi:GNAT superfamily N-acetyltransferase